ncbi:MAG: hypothetical protein BGO43_07620 [Gammaproteobacteria bacterium 39-13]|nr:MAG: hypothetical protein BGO43_07620 [Gammaproteobacteria bacterium 39-13]
MAIVHKLVNVMNHFSTLQISHDVILTDVIEDDPLKLVACIDSLQHAAYKAIEEQYAKFNPEANQSEQIEFYERIINIKTQLRALEFIHIDLTKKLNEKGLIYVKEENNVALSKYSYKYAKSEKRNLHDHYYQLLEKIKSNNELGKTELEFINSLLMQIISRPEGQKLIIKLNSQLEKNGAKIQILPSREFGCSSPLEGEAKENVDVELSPESQLDYKKVLKKTTIKSDGAKKCVVFINMDHLKSISAINTEAYASMDQGLTDTGPASVLLAHELIHATHVLAGSARSDFKPFFDVMNKRSDPVMDILYPKASNTRLGNSAEEFWTIEGGNICENNIRKEHGFANRTGHITLSPGTGQGHSMADLYYLGLQRNPTSENMQKYKQYTDKIKSRSSDELMIIEERENFVGKVLKFQKLQLQCCTPQEVITELQKLSSNTLDRAEKMLNKWQSKLSDMKDLTSEEKEALWISFLSTIPFGVCKTLLAISSLMQSSQPEEGRLQFWKEAAANMKPEYINKAIKHFQKIESVLDSCMTKCSRTVEMAQMQSFIHALQTRDLSVIQKP